MLPCSLNLRVAGFGGALLWQPLPCAGKPFPSFFPAHPLCLYSGTDCTCAHSLQCIHTLRRPHAWGPHALIPCARAADRYFGSFPKVGVVVPSPAAWLLPEFQDLSNQLTTTLDLPAYIPHGVTAQPTGDGFLIWLPSSARLFRMLLLGFRV